jgi:hypothetical protein
MLPGRMSTPLIFMVHLEMMEKEPERPLAAARDAGKRDNFAVNYSYVGFIQEGCVTTPYSDRTDQQRGFVAFQ